MYDVELWPSQIIELKNGQTVKAKCLQKADAPKGCTWKWPIKKDEYGYPLCDIRQKIEIPQLLPGGRHGIIFLVLELAHI